MHLQPHRRTPRSVDDNLIPLINIVFLLLIFFMIAGQISQIQHRDIQPPASDSDKPVGRPELVLQMDSQGNVSRDGSPVAPDLLDNTLASALDRDTPPTVAIYADKTASAASLDTLFDVLRNHGITTITLYSIAGEDR